MQGAKPRSPQRHCRKHPRFSTPCGKDCGLFPAFSQPVENYVEKHGMHSRMQTPQTANPGIAAEKYAPRCPVDMHKKPDGQIPQANRKPPPDVHKCRWTEPPAFPQKTEKIRPQRPVCRGRNAAGHQKIPPKPAPGRGFPQSVKAKSGYSAQNRAGKNAKKFLPWLDIPVFHSSPPPTAPASGWKDRRMDGSRAGAREAESGQTLTERAGRHFPLSHYIY